MPEQSHLNAANAKQKEGDFAGAVAEYRVAIQAGQVPSYAIKSTYLYLGLACRAEGKLAEARESYQAMSGLLALSDWHYRYNFYYYHGCTFFAQGNIEAGKADHRQLLDLLLRPDVAKDFSPDYMHLRDLDLAIEDCSSADDYFCRGLAKKAKGDWTGAIADLKVAYEESPEDHALRQWWLTAQILQNGFPNPYFPQVLQHGIEYVSVWYAEDTPARVYITHYAVGIERHFESYARKKGVQVHDHYKSGDEWVFLRFETHKEGSTYYYWRSSVK